MPISVKNQRLLSFDFTSTHPHAVFSVDFHRTLRIPDDGETYGLPPSKGGFPVREIDEYKTRVPVEWIEKGGVMVPMYQSEAMWMSFSAASDPQRGQIPFAVKVTAGKVSAVTGDPYSPGLKEKDYMVSPPQPWLDGFCVEKGKIRQFVAVQMGQGLTVESQITGKEEVGGLQIEVFPMKRDFFEKNFPVRPPLRESRSLVSMEAYTQSLEVCSMASAGGVTFSASASMGMGAGGEMTQEIYDDKHGLEAWDIEAGQRIFIHLANAFVWRAITGENPPTTPFGPSDYTPMGFPWYDYYKESEIALDATPAMRQIQSVLELGFQKGLTPILDNASIDTTTTRTINLGTPRPPPGVRDGNWLNPGPPPRRQTSKSVSESLIRITSKP